MNSKYKLLATDMDGTLLNNKSQLTSRTKSALIAAVEAGIVFVASTGRPMSAMRIITSLFSKDLPIIVFNGAMAVMGLSGRVLFSQSLSFEYVKEIYDISISRDIPLVLWNGEKPFTSIYCEAVAMYQQISGVTPQIIDCIDDFKDKDVCKLLWIDTPDNAMRYQIEMNEYFNGKINCHTSRPDLLEFVDAKASKALALEAVGSCYGIDKSEMIAVGDGYNDISMLEYAGLGVAMENAPEDVKKICQHVTLSNDDDGVAEVIEQIIMQK